MNAVEITAVVSAAEVAGMRELLRQYAESLRAEVCFATLQAELDDLPRIYGPPEGRMFLARETQLPVGCVALRWLAPGIGELKRLYVRPGFRGAGLGRRLMETAIAAARSIGYGSLRLDTLPSMHEARALYRSLGFQPLINSVSPSDHQPIEMELEL